MSAGGLPNPSLQILITQLAAQAAIELGKTPNPITGEQKASLPRAKFTIGLLEVLETKTRGNRTPEEDRVLRELLTRLRMDFVQSRE